MTDIQLDEQLQKDCHILEETDFAWLLLMNNAALPWFIIVPKVTVTEICDLNAEQHQRLMQLSNKISAFIRNNYQVDKLNVAAIGNVVSQLHLHVVGRYQDDYCWPGVVWGQTIPAQYTETQVAEIKLAIEAAL